MTYYTNTHTQVSGGLAGALDSVADWLHGRAAALKTYQQARLTYNELSSLSDRELSDIGLSRSQLRSVAFEVAQAG